MIVKKLYAKVALLAILGVSTQTFASVTLKLSHNMPRDHAVHKAMAYMADIVKDETHGDVKIRIYPDAQLGNQRESMELMQNNALDMVKTNAAEMEAFASDYSAFNLPYLFRDKDHYYKVLEGKIGEEILNSSIDKGFVGLTFFDGGSRSFYASKAIKTPEDLKGLKIRVQPSPMAIDMIRYLGASPTPIAYSELYTALQQGVVDAAENSIPNYILSRHSEVAKFYNIDEHTMVPDVLVISNESMNKLSVDQQKILKSAAKKAMYKMQDLWAEAEKVSREKAEQMEITFVNTDKDAFIKAVQPMYQKLKEDAPHLYSVVENIKSVK